MDAEASDKEYSDTAPMESSPSLPSSLGGDAGGGGTGVEPAPVESIPPSLSSLGGGGGMLEQDEDEDKARRGTPTIVFIVVPTIVFLVGTFLAAAFMPKTQTNSNAGEGGPPTHSQARKHGLRDRRHNGPWNGGNTNLYEKLERATFRRPDGGDSAKVVLQSDKNEVEFGDALTLAWDVPRDGIIVNEEEDVLALYCPAGEADPRSFLDAAIISQVMATQYSHHDETNYEPRTMKNVWSIPSFPVVQGEETCQFRFYAHSVMGGASHEEQDLDGHRYTLISVTDPISLISNPTKGIHIEVKERK